MQKPTRLSRRILLELQLQTVLLTSLKSLLGGQQAMPEPSGSGSPAVSRRVIITTAQVASLLGLSKVYAREKVRRMKRKHKIPLYEPLPVDVFCLETGLPKDLVYRFLE